MKICSLFQFGRLAARLHQLPFFKTSFGCDLSRPLSLSVDAALKVANINAMSTKNHRFTARYIHHFDV